MFLGAEAKEIVKQNPKSNCVSSFLESVEVAYIACATSIQQKMPLNNKLLKSLAFLDPQTMHNKHSLIHLSRLPQLVTNVLKKDELSRYDLECRSLQQASLPIFKEGDRIDVWWASLASTGKFPLLCRLSMALLTCFHGPQIERSFSVMNNIVTSKTNSLDVSTLSCLQSVRYHLKAEKKTALSYFDKKDFLHDPVSSTLVRNMKSSWKSSTSASKRARDEDVEEQPPAKKVAGRGTSQ